ncbi:MAG: hypothetical protein ACI8PZ_004992 [Myxococcota bacterium]|jgi:hypothetical protein
MCRNIKRLHNLAPPATEAEIASSALQYVRKISGMSKPSEANREAFERAVEAITRISVNLVQEELQTRVAPRDRALEAVRARERGVARDARMRQRILAEGAGE